jgi:D-aminoacyl-tRNA deacylase
MRALLQRVTLARVRVDEVIVGEIAKGWLVLLGIRMTDTQVEVTTLVDKIAGLRAFADDEGKMNKALAEVNGAVLVVSNFTLYADTSKGRRPNFLQAARPEVAEALYQQFVRGLKLLGLTVATGQFGADMQIELINNGPVTILLEAETQLPPK